MNTKFDFKKELENVKKQLVVLSQEAAKKAKEGQAEFVKLSNITKLHYESTAATVHKEKLYYLIGKECAKLKNLSQPSEALTKLIDELRSVEKEQKILQGKLKNKTKVKNDSSNKVTTKDTTIKDIKTKDTKTKDAKTNDK